MSYTELIKQAGEYTYSANVQFDLETDTKLMRFIPNGTAVKLLREYFTDMSRSKSNNHARILYGSYGTGKSHFLTVLGQLLGKTFTDGAAYRTFISRIREHDQGLANDIEAYVQDTNRKPLLIVPIVFDFEDFDRCIYFSLKKKFDLLGIKISFKTFYHQAQTLLEQWKGNEESFRRLNEVCENENINLADLETALAGVHPQAEEKFNRLFEGMTFGVKYVYEVSNLAETLELANQTIRDRFSGIVFIFDEFGRYIEDNIKRIKVKSVQDLAEYCDHCEGNNHIILVSHREISQYTQRYSKNLAAEWKKVEGRYKANSINSRQDQCLSLVRSVLIKNEAVWKIFKTRFQAELARMDEEAMDFKEFFVNTSTENSFESGFPLHPISLLALDRLAKKVAQNDRTFFTYLSSKDEKSLYRFLIRHELDEFHFVGIDEIFDYFEPSIKAVQSDEAYEWYKNLLAALAKMHANLYDDAPSVKILKVIAVIGIIQDFGALAADKKTISSVIDCPAAVVENALDELCDRKILKYSKAYQRYDFFDASIFDVESMIDEESIRVSEDAVIRTFNESFVRFVLYPNAYNREYKISRVFIPVYAGVKDISKKMLPGRLGKYYDGVLFLVLDREETSVEQMREDSRELNRSILWVNQECGELISTGKRYIAARYLETQKLKFMEKDPTFEQELDYNIRELDAMIEALLNEWIRFRIADSYVVCNGNIHEDIKSFDKLTELASDMMYQAFPHTLIVNNELINKNTITSTITSAKKNAVRAIINGGNPLTYYDLPYLSPDYIAVRSVLVKNGFLWAENCNERNRLADGTEPQRIIQEVITQYLVRAQRGTVEFGELYDTLKKPPYGLRDGYLSLLLIQMLEPYKKSLIISSHGAEQELSAELLEEVIRRPDDFRFTVADWSREQKDFIDSLEEIFSANIDKSMIPKNRLKAIYEGMLAKYKSVTKFSRTTSRYVSDQTKAFRKMMEKSHQSYSEFFFTTSLELTGDYQMAAPVIENCIRELETALTKLEADLKKILCGEIQALTALNLYESLGAKYGEVWSEKRYKAFDYYTNAFLEYVSRLSAEDSDKSIIHSLARNLTGIEISYWSDKHIEEFEARLHDVVNSLDAYQVSETLEETETRMTLCSADGVERTMIFNQTELSELGMMAKNKINATFGNMGISFTYNDKIQVLLSLLGELLEGK
ncbi:hypothetical protein KE531_10540 [Eubacteriaceae bacterium Marseille-Q4139]|nr:hypothetical protein [Eubacteriaceae bacterium Marseille-Q4139]